MARKEINIFSVSLLDLLSGALGAMIILYILIPRLTEEEIELLDDVKVLQEQSQSIEQILDDLENSIPKEIYKEIEEKMEALREEIEVLQENLEVLAGKVENLQKKLAECESKKLELEGQIVDLRKELEEKIAELDIEKEKNTKLTATNNKLESENSSLKDEVAELEGENSSLEKEISSMKKTDALTDNLDLVIVMDLTGSLKEEIADLKENLSSLIEILQKTVVSLRIGFVAFRDSEDHYEGNEFYKISGNYVYKEYPLSSVSLGKLQNFINGLEAQGGGDSPEAVEIGLEKAVGMDWRVQDSKKIIVVIGDASAHSEDIAKCNNLASNFALSGPASKLSTISAGGAEGFFKTLAYKGQGDYVENQGKMLASILLSIMD